MTPLDARHWLHLSVCDTLGPLLRAPVVDSLLPVTLLRDYQENMLRRAAAAMALGYRRILLVLPTGGGKTVMASAMMTSALAQRDRSQFIVHRKELIDQTSDTFTAQGLPHGFIASGRPVATEDDLITLAGVQTLVRRLDIVLPPRLAIVDECVTGDTLVETRTGPIRISDLDAEAHHEALCVLEGRLTYRRITMVWRSKSRATLTIHLSGDRKLSCTPDHRIYVDGKWIEASRLKVGQELASPAAFAHAAADNQFSMTREAEFASILGPISSKVREWIGTRALTRSCETHHCAPAVVVSRSDQLCVMQQLCENGDRVSTNISGTGTVTTSGRKASEWCLTTMRGAPSSEPFLVTDPSCYQTSGRRTHVCHEHTVPPKQDGSTTRLRFYGGCGRSSASPHPQDMVTSASGCTHPVCRASPRSESSSPRQGQKGSRESGWTLSVTLDWRGGSATMVNIAKTARCNSTLKATALMRTNSLLTGLETPAFTETASVALTSAFAKHGQRRFCSKFKIMFRRPCTSRLHRVERIEVAGVEDVFDLTVEDAHNFFANGLLVHNCHHATATSWSQTINHYAEQDCFIVGLTATPERLDGKGLDDHFDLMIVGPSTSDLIDAGYLSPFDYYAPGVPDLSGVHTTAGDFNRGEIDDLMNEPQLVGDLVEHYTKLAAGLQGIVFAASVKHSKNIVEAFKAAGVSAEHVDGSMGDEQRRSIVDAHKRGELAVMSNVDLFGEGFDVPAVSYVGLARPTKSLGLHLQQVGRGLRIAPGKDRAIICDHAGNAFRHGLPDDPREWSLEGRKGRSGSNTPNDATPVHQCETCFRVVPSAVKVCPGCETEFPVRAAAPLKQQDGGLAKLKRVERAKRRKIEERMCATYDDFLRLAIARGYPKPQGWARIRMSLKSGGSRR